MRMLFYELGLPEKKDILKNLEKDFQSKSLINNDKKSL